jgi:DNA-binding MarR family transcriptional regulator
MDPNSEAMAAVIVRMARLGLEATSDISDLMEPVALSGNSSVAILLRLKIDGPLRPTQLIETTGLTRGGMTKAIDALEEPGFVERFDDDADPDRRSVYVRLTPLGERIAVGIVDVMAPQVRSFLDDARGLLGDPT